MLFKQLGKTNKMPSFKNVEILTNKTQHLVQINFLNRPKLYIYLNIYTMKHLQKAIAIIIICVSICSFAVAQKQHPVLNHIAVYVADIKMSSAFYSNIIQLDTIPNPFNDGKHIWFSAGNGSHVHLIQEAAAITEHPKHNHICFSVQSIKAFIAVLEKNKVEYENWPGEKHTVTKRPDGVQQIYFKDPDGYWIEVNDATK
jgi:lactoylglutathione lyase